MEEASRGVPGGIFHGGALYSVCPCWGRVARRAPLPPSSSGLGYRPFKAAARVRIPLGAREGELNSMGLWSSLECSRPCQGRGRGFKSLQARWVRLPPGFGGWSHVRGRGSSVGRARG